MAGQAAPDDPRSAGESPILLQVTVGPGTCDGASPVRIRHLGGIAPVVVVALALFMGALVILVTNRIPTRAERSRLAAAAQVRNTGPVGVAAAYRYPLACLSVTIAPADPAYAAARLNRASPCWRYGVYATAIFHRVAGVWRMALETSGMSCASASIPAVVRAQLGLCKGGRPAPAASADGRPDGVPHARRAVLNDWDLPRAVGGVGSVG
jgi:hypothetical protein